MQGLTSHQDLQLEIGFLNVAAIFAGAIQFDLLFSLKGLFFAGHTLNVGANFT